MITLLPNKKYNYIIDGKKLFDDDYYKMVLVNETTLLLTLEKSLGLVQDLYCLKSNEFILTAIMDGIMCFKNMYIFYDVPFEYTILDLNFNEISIELLKDARFIHYIHEYGNIKDMNYIYVEGDNVLYNIYDIEKGKFIFDKWYPGIYVASNNFLYVKRTFDFNNNLHNLHSFIADFNGNIILDDEFYLMLYDITNNNKSYILSNHQGAGVIYENKIVLYENTRYQDNITLIFKNSSVIIKKQNYLFKI